MARISLRLVDFDESTEIDAPDTICEPQESWHEMPSESRAKLLGR